MLILSPMCFSCVFFISFSEGMCLLDLFPCPSRSGVSPCVSLCVSGGGRIVVCLLDLSR